MIELRGVRYTYPEADLPALTGIDLEIGAGELCALVGPNGAGKSTLCYTIAGFAPHHFHGELVGDVIVDGRRTAEQPLGELVKHCGLVFQNPLNQLSGARYTVREELAFGLENLGIPRTVMQERIMDVLELVGITSLAERSPFELSGGQQQRVALASILVMGPRVLLLDEPTSQLDAHGTREVFAAIKALARTGVTVVLVEHKPELIAMFADRIILLHEGRVKLDGPPRKVLAAPEVARLGVGVSRYSALARVALTRNLWPPELPLPVTLDEAAEGFGLHRALEQPIGQDER